MSDDLARKMYLAEIATVREHLGEQGQADTAKAEAALAPLAAKARELRAAEDAKLRAAVLREAADRIDAGWFTTAASATAELRRMADETAATETQPPTPTDCNSGPGWYEVITPRATTCIAYVHEDGSLYLPEGAPDASEFAFAAARGLAHRLVRADEQTAAGARQDGTQR
ncbi:hypothetical protein ABZX56_11125 [Streptomyces parvulus]|uniref:hypothetical protein n=1 Tax=Streptomyces parvulus TaxID=146923 RepID=UPI0033BDE2A7